MGFKVNIKLCRNLILIERWLIIDCRQIIIEFQSVEIQVITHRFVLHKNKIGLTDEDFRRYDKDGEHNVEHLQDTDNLIIKGNNGG